MNRRVSSISPRELRSLQLEGDLVPILDVRSAQEYHEGHAIGAELLPLGELTPARLTERFPYAVGRDQPLYLTCASGFRAQRAAERLSEEGFDNLVLLDGGTDGWKKSGLPMESSTRVISLERQVQIAIGVVLLLKVVFGFTVHELFFAVGAVIGIGLIAAGATRWCGMVRLLALMPWNRTLSGPNQALS